MGSLRLSHDRKSGHEPERADDERSLLPGESIVGLVGAVTQDKAVLCQLLGNGKNRVPQALVVMRKEFEVSGQQRRGVERIRLIVLAQHASITDTMSEDVRPDLVRRCTPCRRHTWVASDLRQPARAVKGDPTHQLRGNIVLWLAPGLPDALVRVTPDASGTGCLRLDDRPEAARQTPAAASVGKERVEGGAEDVVLPLTEGGVAHADRACTCVAREVVPRRFG